MDLDLSALFNMSLAAAAVVTGALCGFLRGRVGDLREDNEDLRNRSADQGKDIERLKARQAELEAENTLLRHDYEQLGKVVRNEAFIQAQTEAVEGVLRLVAAVEKSLQLHHDEMAKRVDSANQRLDSAVQRLGVLHEDLRRLAP
jgi:cell division protein FtsB